MLVASHTAVPHAHVSLLAMVPFVFVQDANRRQVPFAADVQYRPIPGQQSTLPHLQTPLFSGAPLPSRQTVVVWLQILVAAFALSRHTNPVVAVHAVLETSSPQMQGPLLAVVPSPCAQSGAVKVHRHN